jgi:hypothetical protein
MSQMPGAPGVDFAAMTDLVNENGSDNPNPTDHLLVAIFWGETLFNNIKQPNGTGIGFGQVEPTESKRLNASGEIVVNISRILIDPAASVDASTQVLDNLFSNLGKAEGLRGYAGYYFKTDPKWRANRQKIIDGWVACEIALLQISSNILDTLGAPDDVIAALKKARAFVPDSQTSKHITWRDALFPPISSSPGEPREPETLIRPLVP